MRIFGKTDTIYFTLVLTRTNALGVARRASGARGVKGAKRTERAKRAEGPKGDADSRVYCYEDS